MAKKINEEIYFYGGLDTDSDEKFVKQGDYVDAQNIIKVENESGGIVVQMKGTTVAYSYNPSSFSSYLCGWTFYDKNETLIFFIYNNRYDYYKSTIIQEELKWKIQCRFWETSFPK